MGRSAAPEGEDKMPIVGAASGENEPAPGAVVAELAVLRREDAREKSLSAAIDPNGELGARIADLMGLDAKALASPLAPKMNATFAPEGSPAISCAGCLASTYDGASVTAQVKSVAPMKSLIIALFQA